MMPACQSWHVKIFFSRLPTSLTEYENIIFIPICARFTEWMLHSSFSLEDTRYISLSFDFHSRFFTIYPHHVTNSHSQHHTPNINIIHPAIYTHYTPLAASFSFEDLVQTGGSWAGTTHYFYRLSCCPEAYHSLHWMNIFFIYTNEQSKSNGKNLFVRIHIQSIY